MPQGDFEQPEVLQPGESEWLGPVATARITVAWPDAEAALVPSASQSIVVQFHHGEELLAEGTIARPETQMSFIGLRAATLTVSATAHPEPDGSGTAQATASTVKEMVPDEVNAIGLTLHSTISAVEVTPSAPTVVHQFSTPLTATAKDSESNIVLTGGTWEWCSEDLQVGTVSDQGVFSASVPGQVVVTATETESGVAGQATVTVTDAALWPMHGCSARRDSQSPLPGPEYGAVKWHHSRPDHGDLEMPQPVAGMNGLTLTQYTRSGLYALSNTGEVVWEYPHEASFGLDAAIGPDGTAYARYGDYLAAVSPEGTKLWEQSNDYWDAGPTVDLNGTLYLSDWTPVSGDSRLLALGSDGGLLWSHPVATSILVRPAIGLDGTIYVATSRGASQDSLLLAISPAGTLKWQHDFSPLTGVNIEWLAVSEAGDILCGDGCGIWALRADGSLKWEQLDCSSYLGYGAVASDGSVYIGDEDGVLHAFSGATGAHVWQTEVTDLGYITEAPAIDVDGTLYVSTDHGLVACLSAEGDVLWQTWLEGSLLPLSSPSIGPERTLYVTSIAAETYALGVSGYGTTDVTIRNAPEEGSVR
jgi:outer membrane protein assembly factor BamB